MDKYAVVPELDFEPVNHWRDTLSKYVRSELAGKPKFDRGNTQVVRRKDGAIEVKFVNELALIIADDNVLGEFQSEQFDDELPLEKLAHLAVHLLGYTAIDDCLFHELGQANSLPKHWDK